VGSGKRKNSIVMRCHCNNNNAVDNVVAVTITMTPSLVSTALSAFQNNNQQMKGVNKRRDGDDAAG
jgi:hypothetical protein